MTDSSSDLNKLVPGFDFLPPAREDGWVLLHGQRARG